MIHGLRRMRCWLTVLTLGSVNLLASPLLHAAEPFIMGTDGKKTRLSMSGTVEFTAKHSGAWVFRCQW